MATHVNFVQETSVTTGTGDVTLVAKTGFARFSILSAGVTVEYSIDNGNQWETGLGTVRAGNTLERTTIYATYDGSTYDDTSPTAITLSGSSTVYGTNTAQNIDDPIVDSLTVADNGDVTLGGTGKLILPQVNDAVNPVVETGGAGSGTGIYSSSPTRVTIGTAGLAKWQIDTFFLGNAASSAWMRNVTTAATTPSTGPASNDIDTGDGSAGSDQLSHIAGGVEGIRITEVSSVITVNVYGDLVLPKASGNGIKVDTTTPTFGWADLLGDQFSKNTGATKPVLIAYNGAVQAWQFSNDDEAYLTYHIPHDYVPGTDIHLHIHWSQTSASVTGGTIDFKYFAIYSKGHNQAAGSAFTATPITATFSSIDINDGGAGLSRYQQHFTEVIISGASATSALFDRDDFEPDGVIELTLEMDANNLTDSVTVLDPFIHFADIHYQTTAIIGTKDKAPDFYA